MSDKTPKVEYSEEAGGLVSAEALCADKNDNLVPCDSPEANTQVAAPGVPIPPKLAKKYGLAQAKEGEEEPKAAAPEPHVLGEGGEARPARTVRSLK